MYKYLQAIVKVKVSIFPAQNDHMFTHSSCLKSTPRHKAVRAATQVQLIQSQQWRVSLT